jgi:hypothetical protein
VLHLKKLTKYFEARQNGRKIQNGVENLCFRIFALKGTIFTQFQKKICIRSVFLVSYYGGRNLFSGNQNGGMVQDGIIFGKKSTFL